MLLLALKFWINKWIKILLPLSLNKDINFNQKRKQKNLISRPPMNNLYWTFAIFHEFLHTEKSKLMLCGKWHKLNNLSYRLWLHE